MNVAQDPHLSKLFDWQVPSALELRSILKCRPIGLDLSDCGTGKTYKTLAVCASLGLEPLIVAPLSALPTWEDVSKELGVPLYDTINYEKLVRRRDGKFGVWKGPKRWDWNPELQMFNSNRIVVFDEAHRCKGQTSGSSKLLIGCRRSKVRTLLLSATLAQNPLEMKALGYVTNLYSNLSDYWMWARQNGCAKGEWGGLMYRGGQARLESIHQRLSPLLTRIRVSDIAEHFPRNFVTPKLVPVETPEEVDQAYLDSLVDDADNILVEQLRARQVSELQKVPAVTDIAIDLLEQGHSVPIFVHFRETMEILNARLSEAFAVEQIHGDQTKMERAQSIARFQRNDSWVIIAQSQAGGQSLSMHDTTGERPRTSLIFPGVSGIQFQQVLGRIPRAGSKTHATQYILIAKDTIEHKNLYPRLKNKLRAQTIINDGDLNAFNTDL